MLSHGIEIAAAGIFLADLIEITLEFQQTVKQVIITAAVTVIALNIAVAADGKVVVGIIHFQYAVSRAIGDRSVLVFLCRLQTIIAVDRNISPVDIQCTVDLCIIAVDKQCTAVTVKITLLGKVF